LLYTDGATELFDRADRELGKEGLLRLIREQGEEGQTARFRLDRLELQLLQFSAEIHLPDDLTLVKLVRTGEGARP
jgi:serine phosphatase RsbU (regulator of sigma subunit)